MSDETTQLRLEIAHVLFIDIVGYSKLLINQQSELLEHLKEMVLESEEARAAEAEGKLIRLATGDGMALVFRSTPEAPAQCALELSRSDKKHPELQLRMGIHSGPIHVVTDVNERTNVTGGGINMAQRVMDCGDAGHILLSKRVADDLAEYEHWQPRLHPLGECEVKHGVRVSLVNLYTEELGNPELPAKFKRPPEAGVAHDAGSRHPWRKIVVVLCLLGVAAAGVMLFRAWHWSPAAKTEKPTPPPSLVAEKSIAVLPFENLSAEKDDAFFADGIQDDVLTSLGKIKDLTVIARASVMTYRGAALAGKVRQIGQTLGVSYVLEGSVRRSPKLAVINVQLIDTRNERQVWSQRYERGLTDLLSLQGEVALEIARELQATLTPAERSVVATKPTENTEAYLLYLRAREMELQLLTEGADIEVIMKLYQQAIDLDPSFALARARLSMRLSGVSSGPEGDPVRREKALAEAREALRLRPGMGEARLALAYYYWGIRDSDRALAELLEAEKLLPNSAEVWQIRATIYRQQNKIRERIAALRRAEILDPRDITVLRMLAMTLRDVRDWPEAERTADRVRALLPGARRHWEYARAWDEVRRTGKLEPMKQELARAPTGGEADPPELHQSFQFELAILERDFATAERLLAELPAEVVGEGPHPKIMYEALLAVARGGGRAGIERALLRAREEIEKLRVASPNEYQAWINLGLIDAFLGRKEEAIDAGRRAVELTAAFSQLEKNDASAALALIYARTNEPDLALELIEHLLTVPADLINEAIYDMTLAELKWRWEWDPLRKNPRFQKILTSPEPKTVY
ncbi:MAG: adenylate/guanylate cyclase domain-containing protein [Chthoniobacterales bacterium]